MKKLTLVTKATCAAGLGGILGIVLIGASLAAMDLAEEIRVVSPGSVVTLPEGRVYVRETIIIDKDLTVRGAGPGKTDIVGIGSGDVFLILGGKVVLEGVSIEGADGPYAAGIRIVAGEVQIENCSFRWNRYGVWVSGTSRVVMEEVTVADSSGSGLIADHASKVEVISSSFRGNERGVHLRDEASITLVDCSLSGNIYGINGCGQSTVTMKGSEITAQTLSRVFPGPQGLWGVFLSDNAEALISDCKLEGLWIGIELRRYAKLVLKNSSILGSRNTAILLYGEKCVRGFAPTEAFVSTLPYIREELGYIRGEGNYIPGPEVPQGNRQVICPSGRLPEGFLREAG